MLQTISMFCSAEQSTNKYCYSPPRRSISLKLVLQTGKGRCHGFRHLDNSSPAHPIHLIHRPHPHRCWRGASLVSRLRRESFSRDSRIAPFVWRGKDCERSCSGETSRYTWQKSAKSDPLYANRYDKLYSTIKIRRLVKLCKSRYEQHHRTNTW